MGKKANRRARGRAFSEDEEAVQDVGVQVEGAAAGPSAPPAPPLDDSGFAEFSVTGTAVAGEFSCSDCGYGAVILRALPPCPMCGSTVWESRPRRFVD
jgi:rubrerythrin